VSVPPEITVRNLQRKMQIDVVDLERFAAQTVQLCLRIRRKKPTELMKLREIFVWLVSNRRMSSLHRQFLGQRGPTDVLTFQHGEIFISAELAREQARRFGNSLAVELRLYVVHGLLHLHGFDDRTAAGARTMKSMQEKILAAASRRALRRSAKRPRSIH
jgi:probable rRNA maturation factor